MNALQKAAEILVDCGYAETTSVVSKKQKLINTDEYLSIDVQYDADTLEGRRQADIIEDWLMFEPGNLYEKSLYKAEQATRGHGLNHKLRLDRIKWCLEQLSNDTGESDG